MTESQINEIILWVRLNKVVGQFWHFGLVFDTVVTLGFLGNSDAV